ncbi:MAG TPA: hypothetical protein VFT29_00955 [Gemmatimonadaceae bacterium]|nr:hypothetical protein [Gemmatimonadaceae bacterium]
MPAGRLLGLAALVYVTGACARHHVATQAPTKPAPKASLYARTSGGLLDRVADASFRVDEPSYVMVGHLGGDGQIEIIYPEHGLKTGLVKPNAWYRTQSFEAYYDAIPGMYALGTTRYRSLSAQRDSYDGIGHGFIFLIAAREPLHFDRISEFGIWSELNVDAYESTLNPQDAIRYLADYIAGSQAYTLRFAQSFSTIALADMASQQQDCAFLTSFNLAALLAPYGYGYLGSYGSGSTSSFLPRCSNLYRYALYDPYGYYNAGYYDRRYFPSPFNPANPNSPDTTAGSGLPGGRRVSFPLPGKRLPGQPGPALGLNRPTYSRPTTGLTPDDARRGVDRSSFGSRYTDTQIGGRARSGLTPDEPRRYSPRSNPSNDAPRYAPQHESPRSTQVHDSPRMTTPREMPREMARPSAPQASQPAPQPRQQPEQPKKPEPQP